MRNYIIIVRDYDPCLTQPSDETLYRLNRRYVSPIITLDWKFNRDKAIDEFNKKHGKYFAHFLHRNYELLPA